MTEWNYFFVCSALLLLFFSRLAERKQLCAERKTYKLKIVRRISKPFGLREKFLSASARENVVNFLIKRMKAKHSARLWVYSVTFRCDLTVAREDEFSCAFFAHAKNTINRDENVNIGWTSAVRKKKRKRKSKTPREFPKHQRMIRMCAEVATSDKYPNTQTARMQRKFRADFFLDPQRQMKRLPVCQCILLLRRRGICQTHCAENASATMCAIFAEQLVKRSSRSGEHSKVENKLPELFRFNSEFRTCQHVCTQLLLRSVWLRKIIGPSFEWQCCKCYSGVAVMCIKFCAMQRMINVRSCNWVIQLQHNSRARCVPHEARNANWANRSEAITAARCSRARWCESVSADDASMNHRSEFRSRRDIRNRTIANLWQNSFSLSNAF